MAREAFVRLGNNPHYKHCLIEEVGEFAVTVVLNHGGHPRREVVTPDQLRIPLNWTKREAPQSCAELREILAKLPHMM